MNAILLGTALFWTHAAWRAWRNTRALDTLTPTSPEPTPPAPKVSVVMPARNEERDVEAGVSSALAQDYPDFEVVVVDDVSTDATPAVLARLAEKNPRLRILRTSGDPPEGWLGKCHALQTGAAAAQGEWILFADADVHLHPRALSAAVDYALRERADYLALFPHAVLGSFWEGAVLPMLTMAAAQFVPLRWLNDDRKRWFAAGGGAFALVRRAAYMKAGGHAPVKGKVIDDMALAVHLKKSGYRTRLAVGTSLVSVRMYRSLGEILRGFTKNFYAGSGGRWWTFLPATAFTLAVEFSPYVFAAAWVLSPSARATMGWKIALPLWSLAMIYAARVVAFRWLGHPLRYVPLHPIQAAVGLVIGARSAWFAGLRGEVLWRGRVFRPGRR